MEIQFNFDVILSFSIISQGLFAAGLLFLLNTNSKANKFLALLLLLFSCWLGDTFFRVSGIYRQNPNFYFLPIYYSLAFGPLIYFYTKALTEQDFQFKKKDTIHFIPAFLQGLFYLFLQSQDYNFRRNFWMNIHFPYTYDLEFILGLLSLLIYLVYSFQLLRAYKNWIENHFSDLARITLNWLRTTHYLLLALALFWLVDASLRLFFDYYPITPFSSISMGVVMLFLAIGSLTQKELSAFKKEKNTSISNTTLDPKLLATIQQSMNQKELFLQKELSLAQFAQAIDTPKREISQCINSQLGMSFIDFVNQHRVERVKEIINQGQAKHLTLFGIALESGFNSKATFNRVFKKFTGKSPSEYQKNNQNLN